MKLRGFISTALMDIVAAVEDAQKKTEGDTVVPNSLPGSTGNLDSGVGHR